MAMASPFRRRAVGARDDQIALARFEGLLAAVSRVGVIFGEMRTRGCSMCTATAKALVNDL